MGKLVNNKTLALSTGVALVTVLLAAAPSIAKPQVAWSPASVAETVIFGETNQINISFTPREDLGSVVLRVVPELAPFVSVTPHEAFEVLAGQTYAVAIHFSLQSHDTLGLIDGTIQVRSASDPDHAHARPFPVQLDLLPFELPPDPGAAGKETLEGVDSDADGVRDDVQRFIALRHPESPQARASLRQYAKAMQNNLLRTGSTDTAVVGAYEIMQAHDCLDWTFPVWADAEGERTATKQVVIDTRSRIRAFLSHDALLSGGLYEDSGTVAEDCTEEVTQ